MSKGYPITLSADDAVIVDVVFTSHLNTLRQELNNCELPELKEFWQSRLDARQATYRRIMAALNAAYLVEIK